MKRSRDYSSRYLILYSVTVPWGVTLPMLPAKTLSRCSKNHKFPSLLTAHAYAKLSGVGIAYF